jgi:DNA polymerase-1
MAKPEKKLFLLDAMALIYRAHFAFSKTPRITSKGLNTGAVFGFTNTLLEVIQKEKPTHIAIAFDTAAPTFRHTAFEAYKAQRQEQPEDITVAIPLVKRLTRAFNIPVLELDGFEADDIIGTFAKQAAKLGFEVYMMTPDKDYSQLVDTHIYLYKPNFMGKGVEILGVPEVLEKFEISRPMQVTDILGLQGDAVDNIPGIPGVGEKTAKKLIQEYDSVENLIANAHQLKGKLRENVEQFAQQGILSKELATININVPIDFDEQALVLEEPNKDAVKELFEELEFRTLTRRVLGEELAVAPKSGKAAKPAPAGQLSLFGDEEESNTPESIQIAEETALDNINTTAHKYYCIHEKEEIERLVHFIHKQKEVCFDTETDALDSNFAKLVGLSFSVVKGEAYYIPLPKEKSAAMAILQEFKSVFESEALLKVGQNLKYDIAILAGYGIEVKGPLFDTMLAHYLLDPEKRHGMDVLAQHYLNYKPVSIEELIGKKGKKQGSMADVGIEAITEYAAEDADITLQLKQVFAPMIEANAQMDLLLHTEGELIRVLADMERTGVYIDTAALKEISEDLRSDIVQIEAKIFELAGESFNINSPLQLGKILFEKLKLDPKAKKTPTGQYATGEEVLSKLAADFAIAQEILDYRELQKLKSTYVDALPELIAKEDGRVHTSYNQAVAATGRLSSTNPNLQNIPIRTARGREIRKAFVPQTPDSLILSADYSQIELRIMAEFSKDETMLKAFAENKDIHAITAAKLYKVPLEAVDSDMRRKAKTANFGIIYGISAFGLSQRLSIPRKEAVEIIDNYFIEFPAVKRYMDDVVNQAREVGYVTTLLGRRRYLPNINSRNMTDRGFAERNAINAPIQGSAADMIKVAMVQIHNWMKAEKLRSKMILQVHDELVFEAMQDEISLLQEKIPFYMKNALKLSVPIEVGMGVGKNWLEAH